MPLVFSDLLGSVVSVLGVGLVASTSPSGPPFQNKEAI